MQDPGPYYILRGPAPCRALRLPRHTCHPTFPRGNSMNRFFRTSARAALVLVAFALSGTAFAQATRTWVSGVGDDANPCSRTAPCKTFAGAISKTAAGGEINVIDPGGFGAVTITKSITIDGAGTMASILASGTNGVIVNGAGVRVTLRNLSINGAGVGTNNISGLNGIRFLNGASLTVENVNIFGFSQHGIDFQPSATSELFVNDTTIEHVLSVAGGGVLIKPGVAASVTGSFRNVRILNNLFGIRIEDRSSISLSDCVIAGNINNGLLVFAGAAAAQATVDNCQISNNGGTSAHGGIKATNPLATVNISNNSITHNFIGLLPDANGSIVSLGNNSVIDNGTDGNPTSTVSTR